MEISTCRLVDAGFFFYGYTGHDVCTGSFVFLLALHIPFNVVLYM